jgi:hypothetical protein
VPPQPPQSVFEVGGAMWNLHRPVRGAVVQATTDRRRRLALNQLVRRAVGVVDKKTRPAGRRQSATNDQKAPKRSSGTWEIQELEKTTS